MSLLSGSSKGKAKEEKTQKQKHVEGNDMYLMSSPGSPNFENISFKAETLSTFFTLAEVYTGGFEEMFRRLSILIVLILPRSRLVFLDFSPETEVKY